MRSCTRHAQGMRPACSACVLHGRAAREPTAEARSAAGQRRCGRQRWNWHAKPIIFLLKCRPIMQTGLHASASRRARHSRPLSHNRHRPNAGQQPPGWSSLQSGCCGGRAMQAALQPHAAAQLLSLPLLPPARVRALDLPHLSCATAPRRRRPCAWARRAQRRAWRSTSRMRMRGPSLR